jgi:uncharacterized protein YndB with AHSA1/START domain
VSGIEAEIVVARPRQEVFDFISWGENLPQWNSSFKAVQPLTGGPPAQGSQYQVSLERGGESTFEYYDFVPGYRVSWHGSPVQTESRSVAPRGRFEVRDEEGGGTRVTVSLDPEMSVAKAAAPIVRRRIRKDAEKDLAKLKQLLEGG